MLELDAMSMYSTLIRVWINAESHECCTQGYMLYSMIGASIVSFKEVFQKPIRLD